MSKLAPPPLDERSRELWLQHVAGYIILRDTKGYAINNIPKDIDRKTREKIIKGIDDAIYGLMMIMDGVTGSLQNEEYKVSFENNILLEKKGQVVQRINTLIGDGMCMGFHDWQAGEFGEDNIVDTH